MIPKDGVVGLLKLVVVGVLLFFVGRFVYLHIGELGEEHRRLDTFWISSALLISAWVTVNYALIWQYITVRNGCQLPFEKGLVAWFYAELGKYVPSKVFLLVGKIYLYHQEGRPKKGTLVCFYLEAMCTLLAQTLLFLMALFGSEEAIFGEYRRFALLLIPGLLFLLHPRFIEGGLNLALQAFRREPIRLTVGGLDLATITGLYALNTLLLGVAIYGLVRAVYPPVTFAEIFALTGCYALASSVGSVSLFAPSGLGVREGLLAVTLRQLIPNAVAGIVALLSRIVVSGPELLLILAAFLYARLRGIRFGAPAATRSHAGSRPFRYSTTKHAQPM